MCLPGNNWAERSNFAAKAGKYELVEVETDPDVPPPKLLSPGNGKPLVSLATRRGHALNCCTLKAEKHSQKGVWTALTPRCVLLPGPCSDHQAMHAGASHQGPGGVHSP